MFLNSQEKAINYVMYLRKSTDEQGKQETSIEDQRKYCQRLVNELELNCVAIIEEKESAKRSGARPKFNKMIKMIENGEVDGIIAWHPDRLARNMGDGGRIIELVDDDSITDLRFCTQQFSKDANGKMLLGLAFVLSKQYSDKLSGDVIRGNIEDHYRGKALGKTKHGYDINADGFYEKGQFWLVIKQAWKKRLNGMSERAISKWVNDQGYYHIVESTGQKQYMTPQKINTMFKNPVYYGLQLYKGEHGIMLQHLYDFKAMITEDEYWKVQETSKRGSYAKVEKPFKGKVQDALVPNIEYKPQIIKNKNKDKYLMYVVDSKHKKSVEDKVVRKRLRSVRASKIINAVGEVLASNSKLKPEDYRKHVNIVKEHISLQSEANEEELRRVKGMITRANGELLKLRENFISSSADYDKEEKKAYRKKVSQVEERIKELIEQRNQVQVEQDKLVPSFEEFLNTLKILSTSYLSMPDESQIEIAEMIVLNTYVHNGKVIGIEFKKPFDLLINKKYRLAGLSGFEPDLAVLETDVLPLTL